MYVACGAAGRLASGHRCNCTTAGVSRPVAHCACINRRQTDGCPNRAGSNADSLGFQPELGLARDQRRQSSHSLPLLYQQEHCRAAAVPIRQGKEKQKHRTSALNREYKRRNNAETLKPSRQRLLQSSTLTATLLTAGGIVIAWLMACESQPIYRQSVSAPVNWLALSAQ